MKARTMPLQATQLPGRRSAQRGVASLIVVMVLFFIISMVAAYTSRNLIFEQRTSTNQYRSTQALEAADAGLQWALGLLNSGRIDAACVASANLANTSFRQRYLGINGSTGAITPLTSSLGAALMPSCVFDGGNWQCSCPVDGAPAVATPAGAGVFPAFRVRFTAVPSRVGVVRVESNGCTRNADSCLNFPASGSDSEGRVTVTALVALKGGVSTIPAAPLTLKGDMNLSGAALSVANGDPVTTGITIQAGGAVIKPGLLLTTTPGTPTELSVIDGDTSLSSLSANRMFANVFGMWRETYRDQPGAVVLNCGLGGCSASTVRTTIAQNPGRVLWLQGDFSVDSVGDIGSAAEPVVIVASGAVSFSAAARMYGLLYTQAATWTTSGAAEVRGAVVAEGHIDGTSTASFVYDTGLLTQLRTRSGSFVLVPGSWRDF
jgi:PilX N-terminal